MQVVPNTPTLTCCMCTAKLAFKFLPTRESFIQSLGVSPGADVQVELQGFVTAFSPVLAQIHQFLVSFVWESYSSISSIKAPFNGGIYIF